MSNLSNFAEKLVLDFLMTTGAAVRPTSWFLALYTAAPSDAGGGTEVSGAGYVRKAVTFGAAATPGGTTSNTGVVSYTAVGGVYGVVTHCAIFSAVSGGNMLWHGAMVAPRTINDSDTLSFAIGQIALTIG
jgi:hypothetical protein